MKEIQHMQFEMLQTCRDICRRYGLTYFLFGDTLRGAVRKSDFLPDSTEAALLMPAGDLKNFCAYFDREKPEGLSLSTIYTEKECYHLHVKICKDGTVGTPAKLLQMPVHHGISVSLYPYYPVDVGRLARPLTKVYMWVAEKLLGASLTPYLEKPSLLDTLLAKIPVEKRQSILQKVVKKLEKGDKKSMQVCTPLGGANFFWREALGEEETFMLSFAGEEFRVPDRKEVFLNMTVPTVKNRFGDEMVWQTQPEKEDGGRKNKKKSAR